MNDKEKIIRMYIKYISGQLKRNIFPTGAIRRLAILIRNKNREISI